MGEMLNGLVIEKPEKPVGASLTARLPRSPTSTVGYRLGQGRYMAIGRIGQGRADKGRAGHVASNRVVVWWRQP